MAHKYLIIKAFEKAFVELEQQGIKKPSKQKRAELLSDYVKEVSDFHLGEKTYRNYYNDAVKKVEEVDDIQINSEVVAGLCAYLNYKSYQEFLKETPLQIKKSKFQLLKPHQKYSWVLALILLCVTFFIVAYWTHPEQRWMIWNEDHYEEVNFDPKIYKAGMLEIYHEENLNNFKKLKVNCDTRFFSAEGDVMVWYGKSKEGALECFTAPGLHPKTGKTLKKITHYMIDKYICSSDSDDLK